MSNEANTPVESNDVDLDTFSAEFFGQTSDAPKESTNSEEESKEQNNIEDNDAKTETADDDTHSEEDDTLADDDDTTESDEDEEVDSKPQPKKNRYQERINELTASRREAERKAADLEARLAKLEQNANPDPSPKEQEKTDIGPMPDELNTDGTDKYPLGEFDPQYIRDLTRYTLNQERLIQQAKEAAEREEQEIVEQRQALETSWRGKMDSAQERYPDFQEKGQTLVGSFENIDPAYGEYLTATIMGMEYGADVLYYLANHHDEAERIVSSGPTQATIALGRLESKFVDANNEKEQTRPRVSKAPAPPSHINKGSSVSAPEIADDTDDLEAFSKKFFVPKKRGG